MAKQATLKETVDGAPKKRIQKESFQIIEGIGPKIESLLHSNGILTMAQLAGSKPSELKAILEQEGGSMKSQNPGSWPKQAKLAVAGKTKELKSFQAELFGGR